jgi:ATPase subunit of ABC transporter with duplicated ATPase domains
MVAPNLDFVHPRLFDAARVEAGGTALARELAPGERRAMVRLEGVRKSFGDNLVLEGIDLHVDPGEVLVVIARAGAARARCSAA